MTSEETEAYRVGNLFKVTLRKHRHGLSDFRAIGHKSEAICPKIIHEIILILVILLSQLYFDIDVEE